MHIVGVAGSGLDIFSLMQKKPKQTVILFNMQLSSETDISSKEIPHVTKES